MHRRTVFVALAALTLVGPLVAGLAAKLVAQDGTPVPSDAAALARAFYEPFNTGDVGAYEQILAPDWQDHPLAPGQQPGAAGFGPVVLGFRAAFPDLRIVNEDVLVDGDKVAVRSTFSGTHEGPLFGIPATGRPIEAMAIDIHRIEGGRIAETWHVEDWLTVFGQLGLLPLVGTGPADATPSVGMGTTQGAAVAIAAVDAAGSPLAGGCYRLTGPVAYAPVCDGDEFDASPEPGVLELVGLMPGAYEVQEVQAPMGVDTDAAPVTVELTEGQIASVTMVHGDGTPAA